MPEEGMYEQVLTQLYSRKATRKAFEMVARDFKQQTNLDLCKVIEKAQGDIMHKASQDFNAGVNVGTGLRTDVFKMIDYATYLSYCPVDKKPFWKRRKKHAET